MEKDRATEYWDNEIKRAEEEAAKALAEYNQAKKETKEEACEIHRQKSFISAQRWEAYLMLSKWECITRDAAASYKKRKAANEAYK